MRIYGPINIKQRGGTITLNFYDGDVQMIDRRDVEQHTNLANIYIRTGCFCNPGQARWRWRSPRRSW